MKKILSILTISIMALILFATTTLAAELQPIKLVEITDVDYPYSKGSTLDTSVKVQSGSKSYFLKCSWDITSDNLHRITIKVRSYYDYIYDSNTKVTVNGNEAKVEEIAEQNRYLTLSYTFPKDDSISQSNSSSSLLHKIEVMYMKNGRISPDPIRAPHRKDTTVQIIPDEGYKVKDVVVDGESVGAVTEYTFKKVTETHKIKAYFEIIEGYVPEDKPTTDIESGDVENGDDVVKFNFVDVLENEWYYDAVQYVCANNLFAGTSETEFEPNTTMTRAMFAKVLFNHSKENEIEVIRNKMMVHNRFVDVPENEWYTEAIEWAVSANISTGTSDREFSPEEGLTREQLVTLLYRYANAIKLDVSIGEDTNILSYDDAFDVSEYAIAAFQWACGSGIISGTTESTLSPQDFVTRAEVATIMMRFDNLI